MKKYRVTITEILKKDVEVIAESRLMAEQQVENEYWVEKHVLTTNNFHEVKFKARKICKEEDIQ